MKLAIALTTLGLCAAAANADVTWADWTSSTGPGVGTVTGNIGATSVTYTGEIVDTTNINNGGFNYWRQGGVTPWPAYSVGPITNAPVNSDMIALSGDGVTVNTITFSSPVTDPVMAIVSLGRPGTGSQYLFDADFTILQVGQGYWGNGTLTDQPINTLEGFEGHGVIRFNGTFSSISWTTNGPTGEYWNGFTFGVPTPGAAAVLGLGGLAAMRRRR